MERLFEASQVSDPLGEAFGAWRRLAADSPPPWTVGRLLDFPAGLVPWAMVFARDLDGGDFRVQFWGSSWTPFFGRDLTQQSISDAETAMGGGLRGTCMRVCGEGAPYVMHDDFADGGGRACTYYRVALPFRRRDSEAADVVVALNDPRLITRQLCQVWNVPPPLFLEQRATMT